jgi:hypothetical protein
MSIVALRRALDARALRSLRVAIYLSQTPIGVSGKKRLATRAKIFTLTMPGPDSGDSWKDTTMKAKKAKKAKKKTAKKKKK